ncbi:HmuY family protein [Pedobacter frigoris]|uniref:HmuY family protein n=1 Tax=Pedobacter frigoris TaxID=2571272 RepID=UPI00292CB614|nr:HmuY family protein [Pedobacter frigoris]
MNNYLSGVVRPSTPLLSGSKFSKKITMFGLMALVAASSVLTSCKKESSDVAAPELKLKSAKALSPGAGGSPVSLTSVTSGTVELNLSGVYTVKNYYVAQSVYNPSNPHAANGFYYFDFGLNDNIPGTSSTTPPSVDWDISFSGTGNADINKNSGVSIKFLNEDFATASARSASSAWTAGTAVTTTFGHNRTIWTSPLSAPADYYAAASGHTIKGYWNYYFANHQVIATTDVTILVRDTDGDTYAVHIKSVYNNDTPTGTPYPNNFSYLTFEYKLL